MSRVSLPRIVQDITVGRNTVFSRINPRVNLSYRKGINFFSITPFVRILAIGFMAWIFFLGSAVAPTTSETLHAFASSTKEEERSALEAQLRELEKEIDQYQGQIDSYQKQGKTLSGEITRLNSTISKINLQIRAVTIKLKELNEDIAQTEDQIVDTQAQIDSNREALGQLL
ncbi:MAG: hypothetical protein RIQ54_253, partial [Candidatus Parcubacteria bacterium]